MTQRLHPGYISKIKYTHSQHTVEYYLAIKKEQNIAICSNVDGLGGKYTK